MNNKKEVLHRSLGLPMLTFYGIGMILGAGIYSIIGKAAGHAGETLWISFALAAVVALMTALSYAELSTMFPKAGAEFIYLSHAFKKKWLASTAGVAMAFSGAATATTVAIAFSGYLNEFVQSPQILTSTMVLILFTLVALIGIQAAGWTNIVFTLIEIGGLILFIYLGLKSEKMGQAFAVLPTAGTLSGASLIVFSYFGFENIVNLAEEAKDPKKQLPWAILLSLGVSTVLYLLVALAAVALLPAQELAESNAALMTAAQKSAPQMARVLGAIALFSTANTALISIVGASRILFGMANAKALPTALSRTLPGRKTPWVATLVILLVTLLLMPLGQIENVASISSLATMAIFFLVNLAVISLRYSNGKHHRPFKIPLHMGRFPILPLFGALLSVIFIFQFKTLIYLVGGSILLITMLIFYFIESRQSR